MRLQGTAIIFTEEQTKVMSSVVCCLGNSGAPRPAFDSDGRSPKPEGESECLHREGSAWYELNVCL